MAQHFPSVPLISPLGGSRNLHLQSRFVVVASLFFGQRLAVLFRYPPLMGGVTLSLRRPRPLFFWLYSFNIFVANGEALPISDINAAVTLSGWRVVVVHSVARLNRVIIIW